MHRLHPFIQTIKTTTVGQQLVSTIWKSPEWTHNQRPFETLTRYADEVRFDSETYQEAIVAHERSVAMARGDWWLQFEAPYGIREHRYFWGCTVPSLGWWYHRDTDRWVDTREEGRVPGGSSSHCDAPRTLAAFRRHLRRHPELRGQEVVLCSRFHGYNVTATWMGE